MLNNELQKLTTIATQMEALAFKDLVKATSGYELIPIYPMRAFREELP